MGWILPCLSHWDKTAPVAKSEASHSIIQGFVESGILRTGVVVKACLSSARALSCASPQSHFLPFLKRAVIGHTILEKSRMNLL
jgi:hypothetical protein